MSEKEQQQEETNNKNDNAPDGDEQEKKKKVQMKETKKEADIIEIEKEGDEKEGDKKEGDDEKDKKKKEEEEEKPMVGVFEFFKYADGTDQALLICGSFFAFCNGAGMPSFSYMFGEMINELTKPGGDLVGTMSNLASVLCYIGLVVFALSWIQVTTYTIASERQARRIREMYFDATLRQELAFHDKEKPGALSARLFGDITVIRNGMNDKLAGFWMNLGMFIFGFGFGFYYSWRLTLVMLGTLPLISIAGAVFAMILEESTKSARENYAKAGNISDEVMSSIRTVQSFGTEEKELARFTEALSDAAEHGIKKEFMSVGGVGVTYGVMFSSYALAFWYASVLVDQGHNNVGEITAVFFSVLMGSFGLGLIFPPLASLSEGRGAAFKVYEVIDRKSGIDPHQPGEKIEGGLKGDISFNNITFSYPTRLDEKLFVNTSFSIKAGEHVAFSGASGCGKSSVISLVQRMYDPLEGEVTIDGVDLKKLDLDWYRNHIGVVSQEPTLFTGTLKDNIIIGKPDASPEEIEDACKQANIHRLIESLPSKYDTQAGAVGSQLSGGQKQRIAIARALIRKPRLLILDEATSALDRQSEIEVQSAIDALMRSKTGEKLTVLIIAHRLQTIRNVDKIFFIENDGETGSRIAETGTFDELMQKGGLFSQMAARQSKSLGSLIMESTASPGAGGMTGPAGDFASANAMAPAENETLVGEASFEAEIKNAEHRKQQENAAKSHHIVKTGEGDTEEIVDFAIDIEKLKQASAELNVEEDEEAKKKKELEKNALKKDLDAELEKVDASMARVYNMMPDKWPVYLGLLGSLLAGAVYPVYAVVFAKVLEILGKKETEKITLWAPMFVVVAACAAIGWGLQGFYGYAGEKLTVILRRESFKAILRQDAKFFDMPNRDPGSLQKLLSGDCESVHQLWGPSIGTKIQMMANLFAGLIIGFIYSWKLALVTLSAVPVMIITGAVQQMMLVGFGQMGGKQTATVVTESLQNIRTVTSFNLHKQQAKAYAESLVDSEAAGVKLAYGAGLIFGITQFSFYGVFALALWYGGKLMSEGELTFFDIIISSMAILMGAIGAGEAGGWAAKLSDSGEASKRVFALIDHKPDIDINEPRDKEASDIPDTAIEFDDVKFTYPARPDLEILKGFNTSLAPGRTMGLIGSTGSGKSTCITLLLRLYDPASGKIKISAEKKDLKDLSLPAWRKNIACVLQEPSLFAGTIRDNIRYAKQDASQEEVERYAKLAAIHDDIMEMDKGYDTDVMYKGSGLSGGQKQRVSIARSLMAKPQLLLLDEATSALDNATEARVQDGLAAAMKEHKTSAIAVAHRLSSIRYFDSIMLLDNGVVLEEGSHDDLIAKNGHYKTRWDTYMAGQEDDDSNTKKKPITAASAAAAASS